MADDFREECFGILSGRVDDKDAEVRVAPQTPDGISLGEDGGLIGITWLKPERPRTMAVELTAPCSVRIFLEQSITKDLAGEQVEIKTLLPPVN